MNNNEPKNLLADINQALSVKSDLHLAEESELGLSGSPENLPKAIRDNIEDAMKI